MIGLITYLGSSPRRILAVLVISAAAVAVTQFMPILQRSSTPQGAGAQTTPTETVDNGRIAQIFESRPIPARPPETVAATPEGSTGNPGVSGQPGDEPAQEDEAVAEIEVNVPSTSEDGGETVQELVLRPTLAWINVFSESSTLDGQPLKPGDVVTAFDPDGTLIGRTVVTVEGHYGLMALYMDDPATHVDEGAEPGDLVRFEINGVAAVVLGPHAPVWTDNGAVLNINLAAVSS